MGGLTCCICGSSHYLSSCPVFSTFSIQRRRQKVNKLNLCYNCRGTHSSNQCPSTRRCRKCGKKHYTYLHINSESYTKISSKNGKVSEPNTSAIPPSSQLSTKWLSSTVVHHVEQSLPSRPSVLLATCQVKIPRNNDGFEFVRLLIDPGSELSFVTEDIVQKLELRRKYASVPLLGIGANYAGKTRGVVTLQLKFLYDIIADCTIQAYVLLRLTSKIPTFTVSILSLISMVYNSQIQIMDVQAQFKSLLSLTFMGRLLNQTWLKEIIHWCNWQFFVEYYRDQFLESTILHL